MPGKSRGPGKVLDSRNIGWFMHQKSICKDGEKIIIRNGWPAVRRKNVTEMIIEGMERFLRRWINQGKSRVY